MGDLREDAGSDAELVARIAAAKCREDDPSGPRARADGARGPEGAHGHNGALAARRAGEDALRILFERHGPSVKALAWRMLDSREEAEEVLQDAFMRLYRHAERFEPDRASLRTWLFAVTRNLATSRLRKRGARPKKLASVDLHAPPLQATVGAPDDPLPGILVKDALGHLEQDERELLDGAFYLGFSHAELAEAHGLPLGTVKSRVRRALIKLRRLLEEGIEP